MPKGASLASPNHIQALAADASDLPSPNIPLEPDSQPQQQDYTEIRLKDGTRLRLKGRNLAPEDIQAGVAKFRQHMQSQQQPTGQQAGIPTEPPEHPQINLPQFDPAGTLRRWGSALHSQANVEDAENLKRAATGAPTTERQYRRGRILPIDTSTQSRVKAFGERSLGDVADIASSVATPQNAAIIPAAAVAPEVVLPYLAYEGTKTAMTPRQPGEDQPAEVQRRLLGAATATGAAAGIGEAEPEITARAERVASGLNEIPGKISATAQAAAEKVAGPIVRKPPAATQNDLKFGRNPAEAITREPSLRGLTKEGLRDGVSQRMNELGDVIDQTLSTPQANAKGKLDVGPIIDQAEKDALGSPTAKLNNGLRTRISDMADELRTRWGDLEKQPLDAARMKRDIGKAAKWTGQPFDNESNQFLVDVYRGINDKVNGMVPEVAPLNERYADLLSARTALDRRIAFDTNRPASIGRTVLGAMGGAGATAAGALAGGGPGAAAGAALDLARTTPGRLAVSRGLSRLAGTQYEAPIAPEPQIGPVGEPDYMLPDVVGGGMPEPSPAPSGAGRVDVVGQQNPDLAVMQQQNPAPTTGEIVGRNRGLLLPPAPEIPMLPDIGETSVSREPGARTSAVNEQPPPIGVRSSPLEGMVQDETGRWWPPDSTPINFTGEEGVPMEPPGFESQSRADIATARELSPQERVDSLSRELSNDRSLLHQNPTQEERTVLESRIAENRQMLEDLQNEASGQERPVFAVPEQGDLHDITSEVRRKQEAGEPVTADEVDQIHELADRADSALREQPTSEALEGQIAKAQRRVNYLRGKIRTSRSRAWSEIMGQLQEAESALDRLRSTRKAPPVRSGE